MASSSLKRNCEVLGDDRDDSDDSKKQRVSTLSEHKPNFFNILSIELVCLISQYLPLKNLYFFTSTCKDFDEIWKQFVISNSASLFTFTFRGEITSFDYFNRNPYNYCRNTIFPKFFGTRESHPYLTPFYLRGGKIRNDTDKENWTTRYNNLLSSLSANLLAIAGWNFIKSCLGNKGRKCISITNFVKIMEARKMMGLDTSVNEYYSEKIVEQYIDDVDSDPIIDFFFDGHFCINTKIFNLIIQKKYHVFEKNIKFMMNQIYKGKRRYIIILLRYVTLNSVLKEEISEILTYKLDNGKTFIRNYLSMLSSNRYFIYEGDHRLYSSICNLDKSRFKNFEYTLLMYSKFFMAIRAMLQKDIVTGNQLLSKYYVFRRIIFDYFSNKESLINMIKDCSSIQQSDIPKNIATMIIQIFKLFMMKINKTTLTTDLLKLLKLLKIQYIEVHNELYKMIRNDPFITGKIIDYNIKSVKLPI